MSRRRLDEAPDIQPEPRTRSTHIVLIEKPGECTLIVHVMAPTQSESSYEVFTGRTPEEAIEAALYDGTEQTKEMLF